MCYAKAEESIVNKFGDLIREKKLNPTSYLIYIKLLLRRNHQTLCCFPSYTGIANELGLSRTTVITNIDKLEKEGLLIVIRKSRDKENNKYFFPQEEDLMNPDTTKNLAIRVSKEDKDVWDSYFKNFIQPMREERLKQKKELLLQCNENTVLELTPEEQTSLLF